MKPVRARIRFTDPFVRRGSSGLFSPPPLRSNRRRAYSLGLAAVLWMVTTVHAGEPSDPCALLTRLEIERVLGEPVFEAQSSHSESSDFGVSSCFYILRTFANSISLEVVRGDPGTHPVSRPRNQWARLFREFDRESEGRKEEDENAGRPQAIGGIGEEAFWAHERMGGALYVLKGEAYLRISIGGTDSKPVRIRKSKELAKKAIRRL